jgi:hypothetical protein
VQNNAVVNHPGSFSIFSSKRKMKKELKELSSREKYSMTGKKVLRHIFLEMCPYLPLSPG